MSLSFSGRSCVLLLGVVISPAFADPAPTDEFFDSAGVRLRFAEQGAGEPVVLLHGFLASIEINWRLTRVIPALSKEYRVIALDQRAHGKSDAPHGAEQYGNQMVEDVIRLLNHLGIERAHVVGYSMGSVITQELIENHPDRLLSATLGGFGWIDKSGLTFSEELASSVENGKGFGQIMRFLTPVGDTPISDEQALMQSRVRLMASDPKAIVSLIRGFKEFTVPEESLRHNKVPTQAIIGSKDPLLKSVEALKAVMPDVKVTIVEGANHRATPIRQEFHAALLAFLREHRVAPSTSQAPSR